MKANLLKQKRRVRRKFRVRANLLRSGPRVRLTVARSSKHIYAQIVEQGGRTVCGVGTSSKRLASELAGKKKTERAAWVGGEIARLAREKGVQSVVFDRGHNRYHGRIKALAEAARSAGLKF
jgi:large subunit ribosomal protein L18